MLSELNIRNFAIIDQLRIEFGPGLNVLTGETGAGKSILVDAINVLLGSRASADLIRTGQDEASVEAFFDFGEHEEPASLKRLNIENSGGLLIRRLVQRSGKSRAFLNGNSITVHMLEEIGEDLVNIYGQHEHQEFLNPLRHIELLDDSADLLPARRSYQERFTEWCAAKRELSELTEQEKQRGDRLELVSFQSREIARANLTPPPPGEPDEEQTLVAERGRLANAEKLYAIALQGSENLYGENGSVVERLKSTLQRLREAVRLDPSLSEVTAGVESALFQAEDMAFSLRAYQESLRIDPGRLEAVENRLDEIRRLKKKYGSSVEEILAYKEKIDREKETLQDFRGRISDLEKKTRDLYAECLQSARALSRGRQESARELSKKMEDELATLGMKKVRFNIEVEPAAEEDSGPNGPTLHERGIDRVQFMISANPGEELKPLARIASGGELSRIMLALKRIFSGQKSVQTLIFDEVDAGIGGGIAEIVGRKLKEISRRHQIFCITHLPQIASFGDIHYKISKRIRGERTAVELQRLERAQREEEIARMMGGLKITGKTLDHAREMMTNVKKT